MDLKITSAGGRSLTVRSASGDIEAEWSREADGVRGTIIAGGHVIGSARILFRRMGEPVGATAEAAGSEPRSCCGKGGVVHAVKGLAGVLMARFGIGLANPEVTTERQRICAMCDENDLWWCRNCGCNLADKTRLAGESCPLNKWGKASPTDGERS